MGLPALWDTIRRHEEIVPVAQLAEDHHRRHGKPLRIAVDEADWRFNNLTAQQVYMIRETSNQQAFQGIEKAMFYRLCRLLTLNIQLIFVFDGPSRPWKRGKRGQGRINYEERRLLQELLKYLGVPFHEAPGEAEAECARMQILGIVDAVWSQDSDCLMFGCTLWLHDHRIVKQAGTTDRSKENTKKNGKNASVVRAADLIETHKLDQEGFVLFAMLVGGDYDTTGLPQCGPGIALEAVKRGFGTSLCACRNQQECNLWRQDLAQFLHTTPRARGINIPQGFPDYQTLKKYYSPKVTSDQELLQSSRLNLDYIRPIQEHELLKLTSERFNIWGRSYMNWVGPVLLVRDLASRESSKPKEMVHDIRFVKQRSKKTEEQPSMRIFERKLTFSPFGVSSLCRADFEGPHFGKWNGDDKVLFDQDYRVECEIPEYWLRKTLPKDVFNTSLPTAKQSSKRKRTSDDAGGTTEISYAKIRRTPHKGTTLDVDESAKSLSKRPRVSAPLLTTPAKSYKSNSPSTGKSQQPPDVIELSDSEGEEIRGSLSFSSRKPSSSVMAESLRGFGASASSSRVVSSMTRDLYKDNAEFDLSEEDDDDEDLRLAIQLSLQGTPGSSMSPPKRGKFDDIFALREAGRSVQGSPVPAWSLDQTNDSLFPTISQGPGRQAARSLLSESSPSQRGTHANSVAANSAETRIQRPSEHVNVAGSMASLPTELQSLPAGPKASAHVGDPQAEIRAARLRHFTSSSVPAVRDVGSKIPSPSASTSVDQASSRKVPEDIECIDLTDD